MNSKCGTIAESYIPLIILNNSIISPQQRLYLSVGKLKTFNRSLYDFLDSSGQLYEPDHCKNQLRKSTWLVLRVACYIS